MRKVFKKVCRLRISARQPWETVSVRELAANLPIFNLQKMTLVKYRNCSVIIFSNVLITSCRTKREEIIFKMFQSPANFRSNLVGQLWEWLFSRELVANLPFWKKLTPVIFEKKNVTLSSHLVSFKEIFHTFNFFYLIFLSFSLVLRNILIFY